MRSIPALRRRSLRLAALVLVGVAAGWLAAAGTAAASRRPAMALASRKSVVYMGSFDSTALTKDGTAAAKLVLDYLETNKVESARAALAIYDRIIPKENYGGDYTALQWLVAYRLAPPEQRRTLATDVTTQAFVDFYAGGDYAQLKEYLKRKYKLGKVENSETVDGIKRRAFLEDFMLFNNPRREAWEKTSEMLKRLRIRPGDRIADVGSGPGYFTFRFAKLVGDRGKVYAIDTVTEHSDFVRKLAEKHHVANVESIQAPDDHTIGMGADQVDAVWVCSLYHIIYVTYTDAARDAFVGSIRRVLKKDGTLYVVDNGLVPEGVLPYHGPYISKDLLVGQLQQYGFRLVDEFQVIPQRYVLVFRKA